MRSAADPTRSPSCAPISAIRRRPSDARCRVAALAAATLFIVTWSAGAPKTRSPRITSGKSTVNRPMSSGPSASGEKISPSVRCRRRPESTSVSRSRLALVCSMSTVQPAASAAEMTASASSAKYGSDSSGTASVISPVRRVRRFRADMLTR